MLALWNILINLAWPLLIFYRPFRGTLRRRLGHFTLQRYDPAAPGPRVLINAVSAGEVVAITSFVHALRRRHPDAQIALLTTTESGQTMARDKLGELVDLLTYFPLIDLPFVVRRYLARLKPQLYVTTEAEVWPNIQNACLRRDVPVALVNARLYLHNKRGLRGWAMRKLYDYCSLIVCQDERQRENFLTFGLPEERLEVSGNIKFDFDLPHWSEAFLAEVRQKYGVDGVPVVVAGSTHEHEDELVVLAFKRVREKHPQARLIIAPRHLERVWAAQCRAAEEDYRVIQLGEHEQGVDWDVLVIDRYGVLTDFYRLADAVVMGGTFHPRVGGHNVLEATILGKPVIVGPHVYSITQQVEMLRDAGALVTALDANALGAALEYLLSNPFRATATGEKARQATLANRGAATRAVDAILKLLN